MGDLRRYWQEISVMERGLAEDVWVAARAGGAALAEVPKAVAARLLHAKSHRLATEEEIAAHREEENAARRRAFHDELRRKGIAVVPVSAEQKRKPA